MDNNSEVRSIVQELYNEFLEEEKKLGDIRDSHRVRIDELDQKIINYKKNDDVDFKVFSPRNNLNINTDKINELERERNDLEAECKLSDKQLSYYSDKLSKLEKVLELLNGKVENKSHFEFDPIEINNEEKGHENTIFDELFSKNSNNDEKEGFTKTQTEIKADVVNIEEDKNQIDFPDNHANEKSYITPGSIARILHKAEFTEKIITNDTIRAKLEIKEIIRSLKELI